MMTIERAPVSTVDRWKKVVLGRLIRLEEMYRQEETEKADLLYEIVYVDVPMDVRRKIWECLGESTY